MPTYTQTPGGLVITSVATEDIPLTPPAGTTYTALDGSTRTYRPDGAAPANVAVQIIAGTLAAPTSGWNGSLTVFGRACGYTPNAPWGPLCYARVSDNAVQPGSTAQTTADTLLLDCSNNAEPMLHHAYTSGTLTLLVSGRA